MWTQCIMLYQVYVTKKVVPHANLFIHYNILLFLELWIQVLSYCIQVLNYLFLGENDNFAYTCILIRKNNISLYKYEKPKKKKINKSNFLYVYTWKETVNQLNYLMWFSLILCISNVLYELVWDPSNTSYLSNKLKILH